MSEYIYATNGEPLANSTGDISLARTEIVRCRDCKHFTPEYTYQEERDYGLYETMTVPPRCGNPERCSKHYDSLTGKMVPVRVYTEQDGFCAWGKRKVEKMSGGGRMSELKPCPFCGGEAEIMSSGDGFTSIGCLVCNPLFGIMLQKTSRAEAIAAWNTRTERTCYLVEHGVLATIPSFRCWSCSKCGFGWHHSVHDKQFSYCPNCGAKVMQDE